jgi:hypothetical protein
MLDSYHARPFLIMLFPQPIRAGCGWHVYKFGTLRL